MVSRKHSAVQPEFLTLDDLMDGLEGEFRERARSVINRAMAEELACFLGRAPYERTPEEANHRNGCYNRRMETRWGELSLKVPRDREGSFQPTAIGRFQRREAKIERMIAEIFIGGISTRKVKRILKVLGLGGVAPGTVSNITKKLEQEFKGFWDAPIADDVAYLIVDGINLPVRRFAVSKESMLVAMGITYDGRRRILGMSLGDKESAESWRQFLASLVRRGLKGSRLLMGVMDGLPGLEAAFCETYPRSLPQRCWVHKARNIAAKLPRAVQKDCLAACKRIFYAKSEQEARSRFSDWKCAWGKVASGAVECLEKDLDACLAFYRMPACHWKKIRTTNILERLFKEFRRRTRAMDSFPNEDCCLRLIWAIARRIDEEWNQRVLWRKEAQLPMAA